MENIIMENQQIDNNFDGKHLIFNLNDSSYGIPIVFINEIIGLMEVTPIPKTPAFLKGVINLRGQIIPVLDLRLKLNMAEKAYDAQTCIIIVDVTTGNKNIFAGLIVDMVSEVYKIPSSEIDNDFQYRIGEENNCLTGIGKIKDKVVMLLDVKALISFSEIHQFVETEEELDAVIGSL